VKPRLLLDCDCILSDFVRPCLNILESLTGKTYKREDVTAFDIMRSLEIPDDVVQEAYIRMRMEDFCRSLPVFEGAQEGVAKLKEVAHVFIATSPMGGLYWTGERAEWLNRLFDIKQKNVIQASAKFILSGDVFVDDKTSALVEWLKHQSGIAVQWETLHNRNDGWMGPSTKSWDELLGMVKILKSAERPPVPRNPFYRPVPGGVRPV
jgi:5'(3')-deoxyribonucleotidase